MKASRVLAPKYFGGLILTIKKVEKDFVMCYYKNPVWVHCIEKQDLELVPEGYIEPKYEVGSLIRLKKDHLTKEYQNTTWRIVEPCLDMATLQCHLYSFRDGKGLVITNGSRHWKDMPVYLSGIHCFHVPHIDLFQVSQ